MGKPSYLIHYASPYYDPVAAHEYYMKHRHLIGKKATLNEKGTAAKAVVKQRIDAERDSRLSAEDSSRESQLNSAKSTRDTLVNQIKTNSQKSLEDAQKERANEMTRHSLQARNEINKLREQLDQGNLTAEQKKANLNEIFKLQEENEKKRNELDNAYKSRSESIAQQYSNSINEANNSYSSRTGSIRSASQKNKENIRNEYKDKFDQELNAIYANPEFIKTATSKASGKKSSSKKSGNREQSLAEAWARYNSKSKK